MFRIENAGPEILSTNYWETEHAGRGLVFLSTNAGVFRLLVPPAYEHEIPEMLRGCRDAILSRGPWAAHGGREAMEILFEDGTDNPYCLHVVAEQCDRMPTGKDEGRTFTLALWTQGGKVAEIPARYRRVTQIPCLKPWGSGH